MRRFKCQCGAAVFFDNHRCTNCGRVLAFDLDSQRVVSGNEGELSLCSNRKAVIRCNWTSPEGGPCQSCRMSKLIPSLSKDENQERWRKLELAKRRLLYNLVSIGLPVDETHLKFVFKEDRRTNPDVHDAHVNIGHAEGVITINAAEADEVYREQMRIAMNEPLRTLLGHMRHESGHYYWSVVVNDSNRDAARGLFGDERADYGQALDRYYENGPIDGWPESYISAYASAHPSEDWAETWAHYLHIRSVMETALANRMIESVNPDAWRSEFIEVIIRVNEIVRSLGQVDAYPFIITDRIAEKIEFVHEAVSDYAAGATH